MVWLLSFLTGLLTAAAGAFAAGAVASACVEWYRVPSREGASGYFVLFIGIAGLIAGFFIGCVCGALVPADSGIGYLKAIGLSLAVIIALAGVAAIICRLLADIPPTLDGQYLFLVVEVRLPAEQVAPPAQEPGDMYVMLGTMPHGRSVIRKQERGPLWVDDATQIDGRWHVHGATEIFTRRGRRMLFISLGKEYSEGFIVPVPGNPGRKDLEWSDWLPRSRPDGKAPVNQLTYRFRVQKRSEPTRTEAVGPFEIQTITQGFHYDTVGRQQFIVSRDLFRIRYRGAAYAVPATPDSNGGPAQYDAMTLVATSENSQSAILVQFPHFNGGKMFYLLADAASHVRSDLIANGENITAMKTPLATLPETTDMRYRCPNRLTLTAGLYRVGYDGVLDTRNLAIYRFTNPQGIIDSHDVPPLDVSPDERSFVRYVQLVGESYSSTKGTLAVTDFVADRSYTLPIDRGRMHYSRQSDLNTGWLLYHFAWTRDDAGIDQLVERRDFQPLPYRGELSLDYGNSHVYRLEPVGEEMRTAVEAFLTASFHAEPQPSNGDYEHPFLISGQKVTVNCSPDSAYVLICMEAAMDASVGTAIADGFNGELATGKYDSLFKV